RQFRLLRPRYGRRPKHQEQRKHRTAMSHVSASVFPERAIDVAAGETDDEAGKREQDRTTSDNSHYVVSS
ncbi:hypothetical protein, partial [Bradyrhizobium uaiense]|uniref:hypothetical protein n=1 Tax=Bradyrhizobium uaiense TaxID=2594946 RepID=UPI0019D65C18